jgi:hypothetical protein
MDKGNGKLQRQVNSTLISKWLFSGLLLAVIVLSSSCGTTANSELERNEKLWQSQNLTSYDFTLERQCFCPEDWRGPVNISVRNGEVTSVTYVSNGQTATAEKFGDVDTIDELFNVIRDAYEGRNTFDEKAETVNVTYHAEMGYPLTIYIDVSQMIADEEQGYTVEELVGR